MGLKSVAFVSFKLHTYIHIYIHIYIHKSVAFVSFKLHTYIHTYIYTYTNQSHLYLSSYCFRTRSRTNKNKKIITATYHALTAM